MYSLMSIRTIAASSSNRNSASARAVSVLPTPVGPRKINEPIGRFGSLKPARERRIAFATALSASSCPTTRSRRRSSICTSFCISPSSIFETGMPVHFDTIAAMSSSSTSSFSIRDGFRNAASPRCISQPSSCSAVSSRTPPRHLAILQSAPRAADCPCASPPASETAAPPSSSSTRAILPIAPRSFCQRARSPVASSFTSASSRSTCSSRSFEAGILLPLQRCRLNLKRRRPRSI